MPAASKSDRHGYWFGARPPYQPRAHAGRKQERPALCHRHYVLSEPRHAIQRFIKAGSAEIEA